MPLWETTLPASDAVQTVEIPKIVLDSCMDSVTPTDPSVGATADELLQDSEVYAAVRDACTISGDAELGTMEDQPAATSDAGKAAALTTTSCRSWTQNLNDFVYRHATQSGCFTYTGSTVKAVTHTGVISYCLGTCSGKSVGGAALDSAPSKIQEYLKFNQYVGIQAGPCSCTVNVYIRMYAYIRANGSVTYDILP